MLLHHFDHVAVDGQTLQREFIPNEVTQAHCQNNQETASRLSLDQLIDSITG